jgi:hypothetical protein
MSVHPNVGVPVFCNVPSLSIIHIYNVECRYFDSVDSPFRAFFHLCETLVLIDTTHRQRLRLIPPISVIPVSLLVIQVMCTTLEFQRLAPSRRL